MLEVCPCGPGLGVVPLPELGKTVRVVTEGWVDISFRYGGTLRVLVGTWVGICLERMVWTGITEWV